MIESLIKLARERLFFGDSMHDVAKSIARKIGNTPTAYLIVRAAEIDLRARRKPDLQSFKLPLRRKEQMRGRVWWTRRSA